MPNTGLGPDDLAVGGRWIRHAPIPFNVVEDILLFQSAVDFDRTHHPNEPKLDMKRNQYISEQYYNHLRQGAPHIRGRTKFSVRKRFYRVYQGYREKRPLTVRTDNIPNAGSLLQRRHHLITTFLKLTSARGQHPELVDDRPYGVGKTCSTKSPLGLEEANEEKGRYNTKCMNVSYFESDQEDGSEEFIPTPAVGDPSKKRPHRELRKTKPIQEQDRNEILFPSIEKEDIDAPLFKKRKLDPIEEHILHSDSTGSDTDSLFFFEKVNKRSNKMGQCLLKLVDAVSILSKGVKKMVERLDEQQLANTRSQVATVKALKAIEQSLKVPKSVQRLERERLEFANHAATVKALNAIEKALIPPKSVQRLERERLELENERLKLEKERVKIERQRMLSKEDDQTVQEGIETSKGSPLFSRISLPPPQVQPSFVEVNPSAWKGYILATGRSSAAVPVRTMMKAPAPQSSVDLRTLSLQERTRDEGKTKEIVHETEKNQAVTEQQQKDGDQCETLEGPAPDSTETDNLPVNMSLNEVVDLIRRNNLNDQPPAELYKKQAVSAIEERTTEKLEVRHREGSSETNVSKGIENSHKESTQKSKEISSESTNQVEIIEEHEKGTQSPGNNLPSKFIENESPRKPGSEISGTPTVDKGQGVTAECEHVPSTEGAVVELDPMKALDAEDISRNKSEVSERRSLVDKLSLFSGVFSTIVGRSPIKVTKTKKATTTIDLN